MAQPTPTETPPPMSTPCSRTTTQTALTNALHAHESLSLTATYLTTQCTTLARLYHLTLRDLPWPPTDAETPIHSTVKRAIIFLNSSPTTPAPAPATPAADKPAAAALITRMFDLWHTLATHAARVDDERCALLACLPVSGTWGSLRPLLTGVYQISGVEAVGLVDRWARVDAETRHEWEGVVGRAGCCLDEAEVMVGRMEDGGEVVEVEGWGATGVWRGVIKGEARRRKGGVRVEVREVL